MKIVAFTDQHLGYKQYKTNEREQDFYDAYHRCITGIIEEQPDLVLNCGDIFDIPRPSAKAINEFRLGLSELKEANIPMYSIIGNHTLLQKRNFYSIDELFTEDYLFYLLEDNPYIDDVNKICINGINYMPASQSEILINKIKKAAEIKPDYTNILILHQAFETDLSFAFELRDIDIPDVFDLVIVGHLHNRINRNIPTGKILYPGSIECNNRVEAIDEQNQGKGFSVININNDGITIQNKSFPMNRKFINEKIHEPINDNLKDLKEVLEKEINKPVVYLSFQDIDRFTVNGLLEDYGITESSLKIQTSVSYTKDDEILEQIQHEGILSIKEAVSSKISEEDKRNLALELLEAANINSKDDYIILAREILNKFLNKHPNQHKTFNNVLVSEAEASVAKVKKQFNLE